MKTQAAILWETNTPWSVEEIELDAPRNGEVLVKIAASGMCHSDEHLVTGDVPFALPINLGDHCSYAIGCGTLSHRERGVPASFNQIDWDAPLKAADFKFEPPAGASVMRP